MQKSRLRIQHGLNEKSMLLSIFPDPFLLYSFIINKRSFAMLLSIIPISFILRGFCKATLIYIAYAAVFYILFSNLLIIVYIWLFTMQFVVNLAYTLWMYSSSILFNTKNLEISKALWNFAGRSISVLSLSIMKIIPNSMKVMPKVAIIS